MTEQEIFDCVYIFLTKQGRRSLGDEGCMYRGPEGTKCAVGCLLADDERAEIVGGSEVFSIHLPERLSEHRGLLWHLQRAHDHADGNFVEDFQRQAARIAGVNGLTIPEIPA